MDNIVPWAGMPLKLLSNRVWRTYMGGKMIESWQGSDSPQDSELPEEWVASVVQAVNVGREQVSEGLSRFAAPDGSVHTLLSAIEQAPEAFLGRRHVQEHGAAAALLVKVLDAGERLTIQVHPDRDFARSEFDSPFGKTEAWYVLGGREIGGEEPCVYMGFKPHVTRESWKRLFEEQNISGMLNALHRIPVRAGDVFLVEGGVPHAIGAGCFLVEIQEPTDLTLRTERTTPRGMALADRACHQGIGFEKMLDCFHYESLTLEETLARWKIAPQTVHDRPEGAEIRLIDASRTPCFRMDRLRIRTAARFAKSDHFTVGIVTAGRGSLRYPGGVCALNQGDQLFLPAGLQSMEWISDGDAELDIVLCHPPGAH